MKTELVIATKNKKKLREIQDLLKGIDVDLRTLADYPPIRIVENGKSFCANALIKALKTAQATKKLSLGEDSGLEVRALGGKPGIYSSRFAGKEKSDRKNNAKLLKLLGPLPAAKRKARYCCAVALADKNGVIDVVEGTCQGIIGFQEKGQSGFGYDPLFVIPRYKKTFGQLGEEIKHSMSHRFRALRKTRTIIKKYIEGFAGEIKLKVQNQG